MLEDHKLTVCIDLDEAMEGKFTLNEQKCSTCHKVFSSVASLASHHHVHKQGRDHISVEEIVDEWKIIAATVPISPNLIKYLQLLLKKSPSDRMLSFSCDAVSIIPSLEPSITRFTILQSVRKLIDRFTAKEMDKTKDIPASSSIILNDDEIHIIQYIAGFILQKMQKRCRDPEDFERIQSLINPELDCLTTNSMIAVMQETEYGQLTVPSPSVLELCKLLEVEFRLNYAHEDVIASVFKNFDMESFGIAQNETGMLDILEKLCRFYLKIRCHQKARVINKSLSLKKNQNLSLRKLLKK
ncbi:uncharacterized protein LOC120329284 [Styela clava]